MAIKTSVTIIIEDGIENINIERIVKIFSLTLISLVVSKKYRYLKGTMSDKHYTIKIYLKYLLFHTLEVTLSSFLGKNLISLP